MPTKLSLILVGLAFSLPLLANSLDQQKEQLGQQLFFDPALSKNYTQSCASCHQVDRKSVV